jgi:hypothetical protein
MSLHAHFSADYATARTKFLAAAAAAGATLTEIDHPLNGRLGEKLAVDLAWLGPADARSVLVTVSGTHGVEGHYGSGCQVGWLTDAGGGALPEGVAHLSIHASNPYGFSWTRRTNEDNMDINRNFLDFTQPLPVNAGYAEVHRLIARKDWNDAVEIEMAQSLAAYIARVGQRAAAAALSAGQHTHPDGIFYGGAAPCWSHRTVREICRRHLSNARRICVLDLHTGLGPFGYSEMICRHPADSFEFALARLWFGAAVTSPELGQSDSPVIEGNLRMGMVRFCPQATVIASAIEVGTYGPAEVEMAVIADNWLHNGGDPGSPQGQAIKARLRRAFYPDTDEWRATCFPRAMEIQSQALDGLARE